MKIDMDIFSGRTNFQNGAGTVPCIHDEIYQGTVFLSADNRSKYLGVLPSGPKFELKNCCRQILCIGLNAETAKIVLIGKKMFILRCRMTDF